MRFDEDRNTRPQLSFLFMNFDKILQNSTPKRLPSNQKLKEMEQARKRLRQRNFLAEIHVLSDVFVAIAVVVA